MPISPKQVHLVFLLFLLLLNLLIPPAQSVLKSNNYGASSGGGANEHENGSISTSPPSSIFWDCFFAVADNLVCSLSFGTSEISSYDYSNDSTTVAVGEGAKLELLPR
jgi:hypothetical protein